MATNASSKKTLNDHRQEGRFAAFLNMAFMFALTLPIIPSFSRYFKQKTSKTLSNYVAELRAETACRLLQDNDLTVEAVGYKVGYNNFSNFLIEFYNKNILYLLKKRLVMSEFIFRPLEGKSKGFPTF